MSRPTARRTPGRSPLEHGPGTTSPRPGRIGAFGDRVRAFGGGMSGVQVRHGGQPQRGEPAGAVHRHRFGDHAHMVATLVEQRDPAQDHPMRMGEQLGGSAGAGTHRKVGELVDFVAGQGAEPGGEGDIVRPRKWITRWVARSASR